MQAVYGYFEPQTFRAPVNLLFGAVVLLGIAGCAVFRKTPFVRWFSGVPFAVANLAAILILTLFMGVIPQGVRYDAPLEIVTLLGLRDVAVSWPFVLLYLTLLLSLGALIARRLTAVRLRDTPFFLLHGGLWLILFGAGFGAPDLQRHRLRIHEGETVSTVERPDGHIEILPCALRLIDFDLPEYPPKLMLVDPHTGKFQPEVKPVSLQVDGANTTGTLSGWEIAVLETIPNAIRDSTGRFVAVDMPGASPAVHVSARNPGTGKQLTGWAFRGNALQSAGMVPLTGDLWLVLGAPEPRQYISDVEAIFADGSSRRVRIGVNKPLRVGDWTMYQYGYDVEAGRMSRYTILEAVRDPWKRVVYIGIFLLAAGCVSLFWTGSRRTK